MLLDEKRTKRIVQVVAIIATIAFLGGAIVILGIVFFGGDAANPTQQAIKDAEAATRTDPRDAEAWLNLSGAYRSDNRIDDAVAAARRAVALDPRSFDAAQNAATLLRESGKQAQAVDVLEAYTRRRPNDPQGFLVLGIFAAEANETLVARLALTRFLQLDPENPDAPAVRERLNQIVNPGATNGTTTAPATTEAPATTTTTRTSTAPATPATP